MTGSDVIHTVATIALAIALPLQWLFLKERFKNIAREASERALTAHKHEYDKMLEDHRHELNTLLDDRRQEGSKLLEAVRAAEDRRTTEFGLFARERHRAYANVFRKYRVAADRFSGILSFYEVPNFRKWGVEEARDYARRHSVGVAHMREVEDAIGRSDTDAVWSAMNALDEKVRIRDANRSFTRAKNAETLDLLYLSDQIRDQLQQVRHCIAQLSVSLRDGTNVGRFDGEKAVARQRDMEQALANLYTLMRDELRAGR